ncbi:hypothetical protein ACFWXK_10800 [Streptomyces sp. NPDC059070]|uniref:hypothetical protein n=1 Tax=Streptomyces sp. NPDC059070 TaxID=3346713 RepID=UPI00368A3842
MSTDQREVGAELRLPVRDVLAVRAAALRAGLPPRPVCGACRYAWWRLLGEGPSRTAALVDHLDTLVAGLDGSGARGYQGGEVLPRAAVEAADGFAPPALADALAAYRAEGPDIDRPNTRDT